jgi:PleD family two-component response regulator
MKRILYIEDSVTSQLIVRRILSGINEVTIAPTPRAANVLLAENSYDLVITDFLFPQVDALDLIIPLRQVKSTLECPIIAVSGSMDTALANRLLKAGVNACLCKPLNPVEFRALVERMLAEPFVEHYSSTVSTVNCFQWFEHGAYHEYCPELKAHLTGPNRDEVSNRMQALLHEHAEKGTPLGFTTQERVRSYMVQPGVAVAPAGHL